MEHNKKNKLLTWLVLLLLIANAGSIAMFWLDKEKQPAANATLQFEIELLGVAGR